MAAKTKIKFLENRDYDGGGFPERAEQYRKGKTYELDNDLAQKWLSRGIAELADKPKRVPLDDDSADAFDDKDDDAGGGGNDPATTRNSKGIVAPPADKSSTNNVSGKK